MKKNLAESFIRRYVTWITNHPYLVIILALLITVFFGFHAKNLHLEMDSDRFLPKDHPTVILGDRIKELFNGKYIVVVNVEVKNGTVFNQATLEKVKRITGKVKELPGVIENNVMSIASSNIKDIQGTDEGMAVNQYMEEVPSTKQEMAGLRNRIINDSNYKGVLVSADEKSATIILDFHSLDELGGFMGTRKVLDEIINPEKDDNTIIHLAGSPISVYWLGKYAQNMKRVFPIALIVIAFLLFFAFRTGQGLFIPLSTAIMSVIWALGFLGLTHTPMDIFNIMTPILILAIAAGHSVQMLKRYYEDYHRLHDNKEAVIESTTKIGMVMLIAGLVAAAGFFSLITFRNLSMQSFGIFTAIGIISALIIEMTFIPALTLLTPPGDKHMQKERAHSVYDTFIEKITKLIIGRKWAGILTVTILVIGLSIFGLTRLKTENSPSSYFQEDSEFRKDLKAINNNAPGAYIIQILVEGNETDIIKEPQSLKDIQKLQDYAATLPDVGKTMSVVDIMKTLNKAMHSDSVQYEVIPSSKDLVAQYLLMYSMSSSPSDFDRIVTPDYNKAVITLYTKYDSYEYAKGVEGKINDFVAKNLKDSKLTFKAGGGIMYAAALTDVIVHGKIKNIVQISAIIFLIVSLVFLSFYAGLLSLLPLIISVIFNMGFMGITGIWLSVATATISAMAIGLGADYGIYFMYRFREQMSKGMNWEDALIETEKHSGKAILFVASAVALGYLCLMLSGFKLHIYLGILVPLAMIVCSLGTLTLIPIIIMMLKPKFISKAQKHN
jgi:predicted RND superfamily exporter protein